MPIWALLGLCLISPALAASRPTLVTVHGLGGSPRTFDEAVVVAERAGYRIVPYGYPSLERPASMTAADLADLLHRELAPGQSATILAHSAGGLIARAALNDLHRRGRLAALGRVRLIAVDSPWHGFPGLNVVPSLERRLVPAGAADFEASSDFFAGLFAALPANVEIELVFAKTGSQAFDYTESFVGELPLLIADAYGRGEALTGLVTQRHFWTALTQGARFEAFERDLEDLRARGELHARSALEALNRRFPRFPGGHGDVHRRAGPGSFLAYLDQVLAEGR